MAGSDSSPNTSNTLTLWRFIVKKLNRLRYLIMLPPAATETLPAVTPTATATKSQETADHWPKGVLSQAMVEPSAAWTKVVPKPHLPGYPMLKPAFILKVSFPLLGRDKERGLGLFSVLRSDPYRSTLRLEDSSVRFNRPSSLSHKLSHDEKDKFSDHTRTGGLSEGSNLIHWVRHPFSP